MENERPLPLSSFILKIIAMVLMTCDHLGFFLLLYLPGGVASEVGHWLRVAGRLAFPLFMFMLAEGMNHTRNPWKYLLRISLLYVPITVFETIIVYGFPKEFYGPDALWPEPFADVFWVGLTLACLKLKGPKKLFALLPASFLALSFGVGVFDHFNDAYAHVAWFPYYLRAGYSLFGLAVGLGFFYAPKIAFFFMKGFAADMGMSEDVLKESKGYQRACNLISVGFFFLALLLFWGLSYMTPGREISPDTDMSLETYALLAIPFIYLYNGKRGYDSKPFRIFTYLYFPLHMAVLYLIFALI